MGWRGTLVLLAALIVAAAYLYHDANTGRAERSWRVIFELPREPLPAEQVKHLLAFEPAEITAVTLRRGALVHTARRLPDGGWSGVERPRAVADLLSDLAGLAEVMPLEHDAVPLADLGLAPPQATVELTRGDAPPIVLLVGSRNPAGTGVYARVGVDGPLVVTGALLLWDLEKAERAFGTGGTPEGSHRDAADVE